MTDPSDKDLERLHDDAASAAVAPYRWDVYDGVNPDGLRAVWKAGFDAGLDFSDLNR